eukprot:1154203-Pelagomonas_calceolata.AAC.3
MDEKDRLNDEQRHTAYILGAEVHCMDGLVAKQTGTMDELNAEQMRTARMTARMSLIPTAKTGCFKIPPSFCKT